MRAIFDLVLGVAALLCWPARADSGLPPSTKTDLSGDGQWRLTTVPRGISSLLKFFEDQVAGRPNPGGKPGITRQPIGQLERPVRAGGRRSGRRRS